MSSPRDGSRAEDGGVLAATANLRAAERGTHICFGWIDTDDPADGLSQAGLADPWTQAQGWRVRELTG